MSLTGALIGFFAASTLYAAPIQWTGPGSNGHSYEFIPFASQPASWSSAEAAAEALSFGGHAGHLTTITSAAEKNFVAQNVSGAPGWIGGYQDRNASDFSEPAGGWRWITGEPFVYTNWYPTQPDETAGVHQDYIRNGNSNDGTWDDIELNPSIQNVAGSYVEFDTVPEPAAFAPVLLMAGLFLRAGRKSTATDADLAAD